tara:strand:- start:517 stop:888 length:372 start_codon:yes stop_codon:yes gene_type:complete
MNKTRRLNQIAHVASFSCAIHCLLAPLIVFFLPVLGHGLLSPWVEVPIVALSIAAGCFIIRQGYCKHKKRHIVALFTLGVLFWIVNLGIELSLNLHVDGVLLLIGTIFVISSYVINHRYLKCC